MGNELVWIAFLALFLTLLVLDLSVLHREATEMSVRQALFWTLVWVSVAFSFNAAVYGLYEHRWLGFEPGPGVASGTDAVVQFVTGYLLEWSLSVDNIFVIAVVFAYLRIPVQFQYRVLFWGIVGAIVMRGLMIAVGTALVHRFDWMFYVFGAILLASAWRMLKDHSAEEDISNGLPMRIVRRFVPVTPELHGSSFFVRRDGRLLATPMFAALLIVEATDVVFAIDSIPAIIAVTRDPFLVFTSNAFAILGLRSLYFAVVGLLRLFRYIKYSLVFILAFVGVKMLFMNWFHVPNLLSLAIIVSALLAGILTSVVRTGAEADAGRGAGP